MIVHKVNRRRSDNPCSKRKRIRFCTEAFHNPVFENSSKSLVHFRRILKEAGKKEQKLVGTNVVIGP